MIPSSVRLIGMFEQNNIGVRVENPILTFIKENRENEELAMKLLEETQLVVDNIEGIHQLILSFLFLD